MIAVILILILILISIVIITIYDNNEYDFAQYYYTNDYVQRIVARYLGPIFPKLRNDLAHMKIAGIDPIKRHIIGYTNIDNWI